MQEVLLASESHGTGKNKSKHRLWSQVGSESCSSLVLLWNVGQFLSFVEPWLLRLEIRTFIHTPHAVVREEEDSRIHSLI